MKKRLTVIINPISGSGRWKQALSHILNNLDYKKFIINVEISEAKGAAYEIALQETRLGTNVIIAAGGDGTVNEVAKAVVNTNTILGIIPIGSGNGLARHLKIPLNVKLATEIINRYKVKQIDTGTINGHFFINVAGIGFDALVIQDYEEMSGRGLTAYLQSIVKRYISYKQKKYKILMDNNINIARKALLVTFSNSSQFGYNTVIAPKAILDDGFFDMSITQKVPLHEAPIEAPRLFLKNIHHSKYHETWKVQKATIIRKSKNPIQVDGELVQDTSQIIKVVNHPRSINLIVP